MYCDGMLVRVTGPDFMAGLIFDYTTKRVVIAAPILGFLRGQHVSKVAQTCKRLGWHAVPVRAGAAGR